MHKVQLSRNIWRHEFACECGNCEQEAVDSELVYVLQSLIDYVSSATGKNIKIKITSGNRCRTHNENTKGSSRNSKHLYSIAADFHLYYKQGSNKIRLNMLPIYEYLIEKFAGKYGIAYYHNNGINRIHLDVATKRRPWRKKYA